MGFPSALAHAKTGTWSSSSRIASQPGELKSWFGSDDRDKKEDDVRRSFIDNNAVGANAKHRTEPMPNRPKTAHMDLVAFILDNK
jgi:hypothetical protein